MKKSVLIFLNVLFIVPVVFIFYVYYQYEPYSLGSLWYERFYLQKKYIANNNKQKIIFVGGSSTLFGIESSKLENKLKIPVINYAVAHGLRTDYILYDVKKILNAGDVVVLPLEYTLINYNGGLSDDMINYFMTFSRDYFYSLNYKKKFEIISKIGPLNILESFTNKNNFNESKLVTNKLNKNGDIKNNKGNKKIRYGLKSKLPKFKITKGIESINRFRLWCEENNITLLISYASLLKVKDYDNSLYKKRFSEIHDYFKSKYTVLGEPKDFFYDKKYIYNTRYHLNEVGKNIRTQQYLEYLEQRIKVKSENIKIKKLSWSLKGNIIYKETGVDFIFPLKTKTYLVSTNLLKNISPLSLNVTIESKNPSKMIAISLYTNDNYAHFFFKYNKDELGDKNMYLSPQNINQKTDGFKFNKINKMAIRFYPFDDRNISFKLKSISYNMSFNVI